MSCVGCAVGSVADAQRSAYQTQVQISVLAKQLSAQKQFGESVVSLLEGAVQLSQESGKGESFDATA